MSVFETKGDAVYAGLGGMVRYEKFLHGELVNHGFSGGEANSTIAVANSGRRALMLTALISGHPYTAAIGKMLSRIDPLTGRTLLAVRPKVFESDGVTGYNYGRVMYELGVGPVADQATYQRGRPNLEAAAFLKPGDFDFTTLCEQNNVRWLHSGGIFACIGPETAALIIEAMTAVQRAGGFTSFDLNVRPKLSRALVDGKHADIFDAIARHTSLLFGNEEDLQEGLRIKGPSVQKKGSTFKLSDFEPMAREAVSRYPNIKAVVASVRHVHRRELHGFGAYMWLDGQVYEVEPEDISIVDRVGGGDATGGTLVAALMAGKDPTTALRLAVAAGAACAGTWGDTLLTGYAGIERAASGAAARVQR